MALSRLTVVFAENGRGKTTLASVLRSLSLNDPLPIEQRHRLSATNPPHVVLALDGGGTFQFQNGAWTGQPSNVAVFDDEFVAKNVCSGVEIAAEHRQNLHDLILGAQGVALNTALQGHVTAIEEHNRQIRLRAEAISTVHLLGISVDEFCALEPLDDIEAAIDEAGRSLAAAQSADAIRTRDALPRVTLPTFSMLEIKSILSSVLDDLDATAVARTQAHFGNIGRGGEAWVGDGVRRTGEAHACPFCAQDLSGSELFRHYRAYFSETYAALKGQIADSINATSRDHGGDAVAAFERAVRHLIETREFWARFDTMPEVGLDTAAIARVWKAARDGAAEALQHKQAAPLERFELPLEVQRQIENYEGIRRQLAESNAAIDDANRRIALIKERAVGANVTALERDLTRLKTIRNRYLPEVAPLCDAYLLEKRAKVATETARDAARAALDQYRANVFPAYETDINAYLQRFVAGFRLSRVASANTRGGSAANYSLLIDRNEVALTSTNPASPSFRTAMSAGDRNTLALAFFFASLDRDPQLREKIVVIDDPMTSLDEHRSLSTIQQVLQLVGKARQVIVLSHSKPFLCQLWENGARLDRTALKISRAAVGSAFEAWDVNQDCITLHDKRHSLVTNFIASSVGADDRAVATALRPILEVYARVAYPPDFPPGALLGPFLERCRQRVTGTSPIMSQADIDELRRLLDYANQFHHDSNPGAYQTVLINDQELADFCRRTIAFTRRP
jgi:wobble nucleotide-excising tRNase